MTLADGAAYPTPEDVVQFRQFPKDLSSGSQDAKHDRNGIPCKFYNHAGCLKGMECRYSHVADVLSLATETPNHSRT